MEFEKKYIPEVNVEYFGFEEEGLANELFNWYVDREEGTLVVECRYREIMDDELGDFHRSFEMLDEVEIIGTVDCDPNTMVYDLGWNDVLERHEGEEIFVCPAKQLNQRTLAFRYDEQWWFLRLADMELVRAFINEEDMLPWEAELFDETGENEIPFHCDNIYAISGERSYWRGRSLHWPRTEAEWDELITEVEFDRDDFKYTAMVICERMYGQFGLYCDGYEDEIDELTWVDCDEIPAWDRISVLADDIVLYEGLECGIVARQMVTRGFENQIDFYDEELMDEDYKLVIEVLDRDPMAYGNPYWDSSAIRIISGDRLRVLPVRTKLEEAMLGRWGMETMEKIQTEHPWLKATMYQNFNRSFEIVEREGDDFVVRRMETVRGGQRFQYHCVHIVDGVGGVWDDAKLIRTKPLGTKNLYQVKKDGLWGVVDVTGKVLIPVQYSDIRISGSGIDRKKTSGGIQKIDALNVTLDHYGMRQKGILTVEGLASDPIWDFRSTTLDD